MWIARDKTGELYLYPIKPELSKSENVWFINKHRHKTFSVSGEEINFIHLDYSEYPEVTFENSPKELVIK